CGNLNAFCYCWSKDTKKNVKTRRLIAYFFKIVAMGVFTCIGFSRHVVDDWHRLFTTFHDMRLIVWHRLFTTSHDMRLMFSIGFSRLARLSGWFYTQPRRG
ncbi:MAG: hypothetical protein ACI4T9_00410, partial [Prevotella sp.]